MGRKDVLSRLKSYELLKSYENYRTINLALDEMEIKRELLSEYQLKIDDLYNIPIDNVKKQ